MPLLVSDLIKINGLDPSKVLLIRHSKNDKIFKKCFENGFVKEYTQIQRENFAKNYEYWMVFISHKGTSAKLYNIYKVTSTKPLSRW